MRKARFAVESALAAMMGILFLVTLLWPQWIEAVFGVDPDGGDGSLEWVVVAAVLTASLTLSLMARQEWRRAADTTP